MKVSDYMAKVKNNNPRVHEISKDINVSSKDLIALLESYGVTVKNHMTVLENREIDIILTTYLNKYDRGDTIEEYYASLKAEKEAAKPKTSEEKPQEAAPVEVEITEDLSDDDKAYILQQLYLSKKKIEKKSKSSNIAFAICGVALIITGIIALF